MGRFHVLETLGSIIVLGIVALVFGCGGSSGGDGDSSNADNYDAIAIISSQDLVPQGDTLQLTASGRLKNSTQIEDNIDVTWSSSNQSIATVNDGLLTGIQPGYVIITATLGEHVDTLEIRIIDSALEIISLSVTPLNPSVTQGGSVRFKATGHYYDGSEADITNQVLWGSSDLNIATVSNNFGSQGLATTYSVGVTTISAALGDVSGSTSLSVSNDPDAPSSIQITTNYSLLLNDGSDAATLSVIVLPYDQQLGDIPNSTIVDFDITSGSGTLSSRNKNTSNGQVSITVTSTTPGTLTIKATVRNTNISESIDITVVSSFSSLLTLEQSFSGVIIMGQLMAGSQLNSLLTNNSGKTFQLTKYELYNGDVLFSESTDPSLLSGGTLTPGESVGITTTTYVDLWDNGIRAVYYLTDSITSQSFSVENLYYPSEAPPFPF